MFAPTRRLSRQLVRCKIAGRIEGNRYDKCRSVCKLSLLDCGKQRGNARLARGLTDLKICLVNLSKMDLIVEHRDGPEEAQFLELILGQFESSRWREVFDRNLSMCNRMLERKNTQQLISGFSSRHAPAPFLRIVVATPSHTSQCVSEPRRVAVLQRDRNLPVNPGR